MKNKHYFTLFNLACLILLLGIIGWGMNKGLDPMDEGTYLLSYSYHQKSPWQLSWWWAYIRLLTKFVPSPILTFRVVRLLGSLLTSIFLASCFLRWFSKVNHGRQVPIGKVGVIAFILLGGMLQYASGTISVGYSHINAYLINLIAGIFLIFLTWDRPNKRFIPLSLIWSILGILLGAQLFVKFSTAMMISVMIGIFLVIIIFRKKERWTIYAIIALVVGMAISIYTTIYQIVGIDQARILFQSFPVVASSSTHDIVSVLQYSYQEILSEGKYLFKYYAPVGAALFFLFWGLQKGLLPSKSERKFLWAAILLLLLSFLYLSISMLGHIPYATFQLGMLGLLLIILLATATPKLAGSLFEKMRWCLASEKWIVTLILLLIPFVGAFGTNTGMIDISLNQLSPSFAAMIIIITELSAELSFLGEKHNKWLMQSLAGLIVLLSSLQIIVGYVFQPYHLATPLIYQKHQIPNAPRLEGILVDSDTKRFYEQFNRQIGKHTGFTSGQPIIALYDMPGFVFASGNISPSMTFFTHSGGMAEVCTLLSYSQVDTKDAIIITNTPITDNTSCLVEHGIDFPSGYELVNKLDNPYPYMVSKGFDTVSIFVPKAP